MRFITFESNFLLSDENYGVWKRFIVVDKRFISFKNDLLFSGLIFSFFQERYVILVCVLLCSLLDAFLTTCLLWFLSFSCSFLLAFVSLSRCHLILVLFVYICHRNIRFTMSTCNDKSHRTIGYKALESLQSYMLTYNKSHIIGNQTINKSLLQRYISKEDDISYVEKNTLQQPMRIELLRRFLVFQMFLYRLPSSFVI